MSMLLCELGKTGVMVPVIGLGCTGMSEYYGSSNEVDNINVLDHSVELKCNLWDTAVRTGHNEMLLSKVLKDRRHDVFLCTKFGIVRSPDGQVSGINGTQTMFVKLVRKKCIFYISPIEDTVTTMAELVREGKIKYLGLSECTADILRRAHKVHPISALQKIKYLEENVVAANIQLSANELSEIRKAIDSIEIFGYRQISRK
ncbi:13123_t:CDS:2, partial [Dentiscutata heterogama]